MRKRIVQLGGGVWMMDSIRQIQRLGYEVHCLDMNPNAPAFSVADACSAINISDTRAVVAYAQSIHADAVLALNDLGVLPAATYNRSIGLDCYDPSEVKYFTDKGHMRERWQARGVSQPAFRICDSRESMEQAIREIGFPCIVKPCMMWGSRGVSKVNSPEDMAFSMDFAIQCAQGNRYIVEECMTGVEVSVEGLFQKGQAHILALADKELQQHEQYRVTVQINYQADLPEHLLQETKA
ncbi:MAG: acetyl-CoA carboxylase biotin carboxylase subunit family protein, partial [Flavobacteriales bacterium]